MSVRLLIGLPNLPPSDSSPTSNRLPRAARSKATIRLVRRPVIPVPLLVTVLTFRTCRCSSRSLSSRCPSSMSACHETLVTHQRRANAKHIDSWGPSENGAASDDVPALTNRWWVRETRMDPLSALPKEAGRETWHALELICRCGVSAPCARSHC